MNVGIEIVKKKSFSRTVMYVCDDNKRYIVETFSNGIHDNLQNGKCEMH